MFSKLRSLSCVALLLLSASLSGCHVENSAPGDLATKFTFQLVKLDNGTLKPFDMANLKNVRYFAFYYSASWCPPCRIFTPKLVDFYNSFKPQHPDFELIFVDHDNSLDDMMDYIKKEAMPWPTVRFEDIDGSNADQFAGDGIPALVLVDSNGKILSSNLSGPAYGNPEAVLDSIKSIVH